MNNIYWKHWHLIVIINHVTQRWLQIAWKICPTQGSQHSQVVARLDLLAALQSLNFPLDLVPLLVPLLKLSPVTYSTSMCPCLSDEGSWVVRKQPPWSDLQIWSVPASFFSCSTRLGSTPNKRAFLTAKLYASNLWLSDKWNILCWIL
jgi:hypothetical protein